MTRPAGTAVDLAIAELRDACRAAVEAKTAWREAVDERKAVSARHWKVLQPLGAKLIAESMGGDASDASTVRSDTRDLTPRPARGPRVGVTIQERERAALEELRQAFKAVDQAHAAHEAALVTRWNTIRRVWPVLGSLGPTEIVRAVGDGLVGESTISVATVDLRRE